VKTWLKINIKPSKLTQALIEVIQKIMNRTSQIFQTHKLLEL